MSTTNDALNDEIEAVNSIYGSEALTLDGTATNESVKVVLNLPEAPFSFALTFPTTYPEIPPLIDGVHHVGGQSKKGHGESVLSILREVLGRTYTPGQVCLFDLIEEATPLVSQKQEQLDQQHGSFENTGQDASSRSAIPTQALHIRSTDLTNSLAASRFADVPNWSLSEPLAVNKSTFVARAVGISSLSEAKESVSHLLSTNKKVASATHNITAWRIKQQQQSQDNAPEIIIQDCDDDGETAAGGRLLHLMQLMDVWNCVVVVTRWYGGVKLGADRFKCINTVARQALVNGHFLKEEKDTNINKGGKGKKR